MKAATRSTSDPKPIGRVMATATRSVDMKTGMIHDSITGKSWPMNSETGESHANSPRPPKKRKSIGETESEEPPKSKLSLLSRLQTPAQSQSRSSTPKSVTSRPATPSASTPTQGFSIKGAASASTNGSAGPPQKPLSLLERIHDKSPASPGSPMDLDDRASMGHRKRKRGHNR